MDPLLIVSVTAPASLAVPLKVGFSVGEGEAIGAIVTTGGSVSSV